MKINVYVVKDFADNKELKDLATFLFLKSKYKNGCYYRFSVNSLCNKTGLSNTKIKKCVDKFLSLGWCRMHSGNLIFNNVNTITEADKKNKVSFNVTGTIKDICLQLRLLLLRQKQCQYRYIERLATEYLNPTNHKVYKKARKVFRGLEVKKIERSQMALSLKKIAHILSCSVSEASRTVMQLCKEGHIKIIRNRKTLFRGVKKSHFNNNIDLFKSCYFNNGNIIKVSCNEYVF